MIPFWPSLVEDSAEKGWHDGVTLSPYSPILQWGINQEIDSAYSSAYFWGMIYHKPKEA